jgi:diguanylate cyclase (GGDEF)-like protein
LTLVVLDLDHFKAINDTHGHPAGDAVLAAVARVFAGQVRSIDRVARIGGEEFAVLLMVTGADEGLAVAKRIVEAVRALPVAVAGGATLRITVSAGVAALPAYGEAETQLPETADQALYAAKRAGQDCAVLAS